MKADVRQGPIGKNVCYCTHYGESSESLEGDRGRDRVQQYHLLMSFQARRSTPEIVLSKKKNSESKMANYNNRYYQLSYVITSKFLPTHFLFLFSFKTAFTPARCHIQLSLYTVLDKPKTVASVINDL